MVSVCCFVAVEANKRAKAMRDLVMLEIKCRPVDIFELLLNTAQLELKLKEVHPNTLLPSLL